MAFDRNNIRSRRKAFKENAHDAAPGAEIARQAALILQLAVLH
jgi:hypothetical protein